METVEKVIVIRLDRLKPKRVGPMRDSDERVNGEQVL
jgi:hypothetical protein